MARKKTHVGEVQEDEGSFLFVHIEQIPRYFDLLISYNAVFNDIPIKEVFQRAYDEVFKINEKISKKEKVEAIEIWSREMLAFRTRVKAFNEKNADILVDLKVRIDFPSNFERLDFKAFIGRILKNEKDIKKVSIREVFYYIVWKYLREILNDWEPTQSASAMKFLDKEKALVNGDLL